MPFTRKQLMADFSLLRKKREEMEKNLSPRPTGYLVDSKDASPDAHFMAIGELIEQHPIVGANRGGYVCGPIS